MGRLFAVILLASAAASAAEAYDVAKATANWKAVNDGKTAQSALPAAERDELMQLLRDMRRSTPVGAKAECKAAWSRADREKDKAKAAADKKAWCG